MMLKYKNKLAHLLKFLISVFLIIFTVSSLSYASGFETNNLRHLLYQSDYQTYEIHFNDRKYDIPYYISGNNNIESINLEYFNSALQSVSININSLEDGDLLIKIPYEFAKTPTSNYSFLPIVDGTETSFEINGMRSLATYLSIHFKKENSKIEIIPVYDLSTGCASTTSKLITQLGCGFTNEDIVCADGFQKIFKKLNNFPACVSPTTAEKLIQRGWA